MSGLAMDGVTLGVIAAAVAAPCFTFLQYILGGKERVKRLELEEQHLKGKADLAESIITAC